MSPAPEYVVRRSTRRRKTISAHREGETIVVDVPARLSAAEEARLVPDLVRQFLAKEERRIPPASDDGLLQRAIELAGTHLVPQAPHMPMPASVRWVTNQHARWASCTSLTREIRLSVRLQQMPTDIVDHVLLHELAHLIEPNHSPRFHALLDHLPGHVRAQGFLDGWTAAERARTGSVPPADVWD